MQSSVRMRDVWTVDDLRELDVEDWRRAEIVDGALVVSPPPGKIHEYVAEELRAAIRRALPAGLKVVGPLGLELPRSYRIPDLLVLPVAFFRSDQPKVEPDDVVLAIEVVSPGSTTTDRVTKPAQYAAAGIAAYWRVETEPVGLTAYVLPPGADTYAESGSWGPEQTARLTEPFSVEVDLGSLAP